MKSLTLIATILSAALAQADILLWQLNDAELKSALPESYQLVTEARLVAGTPAGGTEKTLQYAVVDWADVPVSEVQAFDMSVFPDAPSKSFYLEFYSFSSEGSAVLQAYTDMVTYEAIREFMSPSLMTTDLKVWSGGTYHAAPEPTGGVMLLIGAALLGLRRRKTLV